MEDLYLNWYRNQIEHANPDNYTFMMDVYCREDELAFEKQLLIVYYPYYSN
jgi:nicotinic acid phosphoribosyltransferase